MPMLFALLCSTGCVTHDIVVSGGRLAVAVRDFADAPTTTEVAVGQVTLTRQSEVELRQRLLFLPTNRSTTVGALVQECLATRSSSAGEQTCELSGEALVGSEIDFAASAGIWAGASAATVVLGVLLGLVIHATSNDTVPPR